MFTDLEGISKFAICTDVKYKNEKHDSVYFVEFADDDERIVMINPNNFVREEVSKGELTHIKY